MQSKRVAFGTKVAGEVLDIQRLPVKESHCNVVTFGGDDDEGYVLVLADAQMEAEEIGQRGYITFLPGGPYGGYWHFKPERTSNASADD